MNETVIRHPLSRDLLQVVASPAALHRFVMRVLPDLGGLSGAIRADTSTLFRLDLPTDRLGAAGMVCLRVRSAALPHDLPVTESHPPGPGDRFTVRVAAARRRTTPTGREIARPVPDADAADWAGELLDRHGLPVQDLAVSAARTFGRRGVDEVRYTVRDLTATLAPAEPARIHEAFTRGIGHGRAYGLGMIVALPDHTPTARS